MSRRPGGRLNPFPDGSIAAPRSFEIPRRFTAQCAWVGGTAEAEIWLEGGIANRIDGCPRHGADPTIEK